MLSFTSTSSHPCSSALHFDVIPTAFPFLALIYPLLQPLIGIRNPLVEGRITTLLELGSNYTFEHFTRKADKVVSPQRVLKLPISTLALLPRQELKVSNFPGPYAQIAHHGEQIEPNLCRIIPRNPPLQHLHDFGGKLFL